MAARTMPLATVVAFITGLLMVSPARSGPPYVTDDPEPTDQGKWETYAFGSATSLRHATEGAGGFDINYGGGRDLQLSAVLTMAYGHDAGAPAHIGVADTEVGAKYRFLHQSEGSAMPDVGIFPKIELPTAGKRFGAGKLGLKVPVWAQKDFGPWSLFGGGGWALNPGAGNRNYGFEGVAITRQVMKTLSLGGEIYHQSADAVDGRSSSGLGVGASWQFAPKWSLIGSGGPMISHRTTAGDYAVYLALEFHN